MQTEWYGLIVDICACFSDQVSLRHVAVVYTVLNVFQMINCVMFMNLNKKKVLSWIRTVCGVWFLLVSVVSLGCRGVVITVKRGLAE